MIVEEFDCENLKGKNWVATMMLCWSLGTFGAHRFYTGKKGSAWAMLIMTITVILAPVSAIWALFDGVMIALGKFKHMDGCCLYERINWLGYLYIIVMFIAIITAILSLIFGGIEFISMITSSPAPNIMP